MSVEAFQLEKTYRRLGKTEQTTFISRVQAYLKREYHLVRALDKISFTVKPGEKVTILGPNGAGKSTIIKILTGIIQSDGGEASVNGYNPQKARYNAAYQFGVVFGHRSLLWRHIPVIESLRLYRDVYELDKKTFEKRLAEFIDVLEIKPFLHRQPRRLSLGERMRCELAASLIHNPKIVFLKINVLILCQVFQLFVASTFHGDQLYTPKQPSPGNSYQLFNNRLYCFGFCFSSFYFFIY